MKINIPTQLLRGLFAISLLTAALTKASADEEGSTVTVKLSSPDKPATLRIDVPWADIEVVGVDS